MRGSRRRPREGCHETTPRTPRIMPHGERLWAIQADLCPDRYGWVTRIARKSFTLVRVGPKTIKSPSAEKTP